MCSSLNWVDLYDVWIVLTKVGFLSYTVLCTHQVVFEAIRGRSDRSDIAIDDVAIHGGDCPAPGSCDFERENLCTWSNSEGDDFDWVLFKGTTASGGTGPTADHTMGNDQGLFCLIVLLPGFLT